MRQYTIGVMAGFAFGAAISCGGSGGGGGTTDLRAQQRPAGPRDRDLSCFDINEDGTVSMADPIAILNYLVQTGFIDECEPEPIIAAINQVTCRDFEGFAVDCNSADACDAQQPDFGRSNAGRWIDNGDGTVTDDHTGLMWQVEVTREIAWCDAISYCEDLELAQHDDWRLPNIRELQTIIDYSRFQPATDPVFREDYGAELWSSTSLPDLSDRFGSSSDRPPRPPVWRASTQKGAISWTTLIDGQRDLNLADVRAVRGG